MSQKIPSILDLPNNIKRNFKVIIDGKEITVKKRLSVERNDFVRFEYGMSPLGFDAIALEEMKGGAVVVPYSINKGELFVGLVEERRANMADKNHNDIVFNLPRGMAARDESFLEAARRENGEELNINANGILYKKLSRALNPNSTYFATIPLGKKGIVFYSAKFDQKMLSKYKSNVYKVKTKSRENAGDPDEKIFKCLFFHWTKIFDTYDMISWLGVLLLRESLNADKVI